MGAWGTKLYQDDVAQDVRDQFKDLLKRGGNADDITKGLIEEYSCLLDDPDDAPVFWFALADTQWNFGRLLPEVAEQAFLWLDKGTDLARWEAEEPKQAAARANELMKLRQKLNTPQPPEKKVPQYRLYKCEWKIGDVFSYKLESDFAKEKGLLGQNFLIQKMGERTWHPGHIIPFARVKIARGEKLPADTKEFDQLEYIQTSFTKYENRFEPINGRRPYEDIAEKSKIKYEVDEFGYLPEYRIALLSTSKKIIPSKLVYVGNFPDAEPPKIEFIPHCELNSPSISWKKFEEELISQYCGYNQRQFKSYQVNNTRNVDER